jgi:hypothetical protein
MEHMMEEEMVNLVEDSTLVNTNMDNMEVEEALDHTRSEVLEVIK